MKRTLILIAACLTVMLFSGDISQADGLQCCGDGYASISVYQMKNGFCQKNSDTHSCDRVNECTPQCNQGDIFECILAGYIWKGSPYCQCHTGCGISDVQNCLYQGRDTDPDTCQCKGTCSASLVSACLTSGGWMDYVECNCHYADPCEFPVAHLSYGYILNCMYCNYSCSISTGEPLIIKYYGTDKVTHCRTEAYYYANEGDLVCYETSSCYPLCCLGLYL